MGQRQRLDDAGRAALREVAPRIVAEFRGEHNRKRSSRREMRWGRKGSFSLVIAGPKAGCWFDHELGRGGDIIEFIKAERGCSFAEALDFAAQFVPAAIRIGAQADAADRSRRRRRREAHRAGAQHLVRGPGHCAGRWLKSICARAASRCPTRRSTCWRFHPACPWEGSRRPALVALVRDIVTDEPLGIHRTALSADGARLTAPRPWARKPAARSSCLSNPASPPSSQSARASRPRCPR